LSADKIRQAYDRLEQSTKDGARRRKILFEEGESFGFKGHRFEVVHPDEGTAPFLRFGNSAKLSIRPWFLILLPKRSIIIAIVLLRRLGGIASLSRALRQLGTGA
jgi:hypothetical protein